ncbi:unnamed protein product [Tetraodon nigroviridis]|uniref:Chromosome undetermined SCAF14504, whole genome shotgun sequence n=1 Tax=Tetraodon nigroviridis TaxID=99883 RepID=Q4SRQ1_TETNG|nr:unnamed protein product [Tetraodon nigroviridis]
MKAPRSHEAEMRPKNNEVGRKRMSLFIQQVEKEAQQRMTELEARVETMQETIDQAFRVEMMKMPPSLLSTRMGEEEFFSSEASAAPKVGLLRASGAPLAAGRVKSMATPDNSTPPERTASKSSRAGKAAQLPRTLASSSSTGNLGSSSAATKRSQSRATKTAERPKLRRGSGSWGGGGAPLTALSPSRPVASTGDLHCAMAASAAHITVTTGLGQTISFSEETKHEVDLDLLDDVAWCHIQRLTSLMEHLWRRSQR